MTEWRNSRYLTMMVTRKELSFPVSIAVSSLPLKDLVLKSAGFLHPDEYTTFTGDAQYHYLSGRHAAKLAACNFTGTDPAVMQISAGVFGQPVLNCPHHNNLQVSIAHSTNNAIAIVFPEWHPMAIDIEQTGNNSLLPPLLPAEAALMTSLRYSAAEKGLLLWTAREALSKILKTGLTTDLEIFSIKAVVTDGDFLISTFVHFVQYKAISWVAGNMVCSLVLPERSQVDTAALSQLFDRSK